MNMILVCVRFRAGNISKTNIIWIASERTMPYSLEEGTAAAVIYIYISFSLDPKPKTINPKPGTQNPIPEYCRTSSHASCPAAFCAEISDHNSCSNEGPEKPQHNLTGAKLWGYVI